MRGEFDFIKALKSKLTPDSSLIGIGDDAAVINQNSELQTIVSQDLLVEDIDFRRAWMPLNHLARALGHKALAVSLSDIAAMGATPRYCLTSIGLPENVWRTKFIDEFYDSLLALARQHNTQLIGGDTSRSPDRIVIDCTVIGEIKHGRAILRSTAKVGDIIFVSGELGGAAAGLKLLENGKRLSTGRTANPSLLTMDALIKRQLTPTPRVTLGCHLSQHNLATSMIDTSDGLAADLHHLCHASDTGALIDESRLPVAHAIHQLKTTRPPADLALNGGEDYELLFTVSPADKHKIPARFDDESLTEIGVITETSEGIAIKTDGRTRPLKAKGFVHF